MRILGIVVRLISRFIRRTRPEPAPVWPPRDRHQPVIIEAIRGVDYEVI